MANRTPCVLVIGDVMLDIIAAPRKPIEPATDTPAAITLAPGGSGANVAAWLGYFGNTVRFVGRVGHDTYAEHMAALRTHGVTPIFALDETLRTGTLVTLVGADGERSFLTDRGANARLARADLPDVLLDGVDFVHVSGYALFADGPRAAIRDFLTAAVTRDIRIGVDTGSLSYLRNAGPAAFLDWTSSADLCFANAAEAGLLADSVLRCEQLARLGAAYETLVITCGAAGAVAATRHGARQYSATAPRLDAVDTTGAGDAFLAGFLTAYLRAEDVDDALRAGIAAGSGAVLHYGGRPAAAFASVRLI